MSNIDKQALREAAEKATPGEWFPDDRDGVIADAGLNENYYIASCSGPEHQDNKRFIAAANPATVLALLDELEAAEKRIAELELRLSQQQSIAANNLDMFRRADARVSELEAREVVLPQRHSMLHRDNFDEPYHTEFVYKQHQVLEALRDTGIITKVGE